MINTLHQYKNIYIVGFIPRFSDWPSLDIESRLGLSARCITDTDCICWSFNVIFKEKEELVAASCLSEFNLPGWRWKLWLLAAAGHDIWLAASIFGHNIHLGACWPLSCRKSAFFLFQGVNNIKRSCGITGSRCSYSYLAITLRLGAVHRSFLTDRRGWAECHRSLLAICPLHCSPDKPGLL